MSGPLVVHRWSGERPAVMGLHGFTGSGLDFAPLVESLGLSFLAPDLPGHGQSPLPAIPGSLGLQAQARRVEASWEQEKAEVLLGYSMGGRLALTIATRDRIPVSGLVLVGATPGLADPAGRQQRRVEDAALARHIREVGVEVFSGEWASRPIIASQRDIASPHLEAMGRRRLKNVPEALARSLEEAGTGSMQPLWGQLSGIRCPVLLLVGERDPVYREIAGQMASRIPGARVRVVAGAGHCAHLEQARIVGPWLEDFARSCVR
ncbi:MAG: alpha/beta fold hydrolase [Myxococcota bacterium]|nr:alpha/beta fold hydrolase [Myxococcota bacterium]